MRTVSRIAELRAALVEARARGRRVALVPTMGFLHDGHLALVDAARERADVVVMSIFVNPLQFAPTDDLARYPRDPDGDAAKARARGVDLLFTPAVSEMYAGPGVVRVVPERIDARWEGAVRPGHFAGVLTVVAKLFNIVQPDVAIFGQKDIQQATLIRAMVRDLDVPVQIVIAPTVREADGLAMSSRNSYLDAADRRRATVLSRALAEIDRRFRDGEHDVATLERAGRAVLATDPALRVDYLAIAEPVALEPARAAAAGCVVMVAARVGSTRLIDNAVLGDDAFTRLETEAPRAAGAGTR